MGYSSELLYWKKVKNKSPVLICTIGYCEYAKYIFCRFLFCSGKTSVFFPRVLFYNFCRAVRIHEESIFFSEIALFRAC